LLSLDFLNTYADKEAAGHLPETPGILNSLIVDEISLTLTYPKHLRPTRRTNTLSGGFAILHSYGFCILHFLLGAAFNTISFHYSTPFLIKEHKTFSFLLSRGRREKPHFF